MTGYNSMKELKNAFKWRDNYMKILKEKIHIQVYPTITTKIKFWLLTFSFCDGILLIVDLHLVIFIRDVNTNNSNYYNTNYDYLYTIYLTAYSFFLNFLHLHSVLGKKKYNKKTLRFYFATFSKENYLMVSHFIENETVF